MKESLLARLRRMDHERPSFPGEHWLALGAGLWLLTRRDVSPLGRLVALASGAVLVCRAASGRDGLARLWMNPQRGAAARAADRRTRGFVDLAAPWPERKRVRVSAISQPIGRTIDGTIGTP